MFYIKFIYVYNHLISHSQNPLAAGLVHPNSVIMTQLENNRLLFDSYLCRSLMMCHYIYSTNCIHICLTVTTCTGHMMMFDRRCLRQVLFLESHIIFILYKNYIALPMRRPLCGDHNDTNCKGKNGHHIYRTL